MTTSQPVGSAWKGLISNKVCKVLQPSLSTNDRTAGEEEVDELEEHVEEEAEDCSGGGSKKYVIRRDDEERL